MKRIAVLFLLLPMLLFGTLAHAAVPSVEQVQAEVKAGRYGEAESMMREVVAAKPESARAHYVYAEVLARTGKRDEALRQVAEARRLDPSIKFADKERFEQFERTLQAGGRGANGSAYAGPATGSIAGPDGGTATRAAPSAEPARRSDAVPAGRAEAERGSGVPGWLLLAGVVLAAVVVWRLIAARRSSAARPMAAMPPASGYPVAPGQPGGPGYPGGVNPGYGYGPGVQPGAAPGRGPGMMGVGLGVAGGLAAGMLAERMLNGNEAQAASHDAPQGDAAAAGGAGYSPGVFDDASGANALRDQPVDFGSGGSDWDSGGGGDSFDAGGGGGGGDENW